MPDRGPPPPAAFLGHTLRLNTDRLRAVRRNPRGGIGYRETPRRRCHFHQAIAGPMESPKQLAETRAAPPSPAPKRVLQWVAFAIMLGLMGVGTWLLMVRS